jgi:hypothetical protein
MRKICVCLGFVCLSLFSVCQSVPQPRPLDLATVTEEIPISSVSIMVRADVDVDKKGESFLRTFYTENIDLIKEMLVDKGIKINDTLFLEDFNNNPGIEFEEIDLFSTLMVHLYSWESQTQPETHAKLALSFVIREDGTMPLEVTVKKSDPEYEPGYAAKVMLGLKVNVK